LQNFHLQKYRPVVVAAPALGAPGASRGPVLPLAQLEKEAILETLRKLDGDKLLAARLLGIGKTTLYRKLKEYGISAPDAGNEAEDHAG
jgi:two-component system response regulator HydG